MAPLPYRDLNGYLQELFGERVQKITLDAGLTCPNRDGWVGRGGCLYCNSRGSGTGAWSRGQSISRQLEEGLAHARKRYGARKFIAYFQSFTNTYAPVEHLRGLYQEALAFPGVVGLSIGTRPDCLPDAVLDLVAEYASEYLVWLELGLQSAHDATLQRLNRGHDVSCFTGAAARAAARGLEVVAHVILGLPGEGPAEMAATASYLARQPLQGVKIHLLYVTRDSDLAQLYRSGAYRCLTEKEYVSAVADFLELLPPHLVIHRLTGDPHPGELLAPDWCRHKSRVISLIQEEFSRRGSRQGRRFRPSAGLPEPGPLVVPRENEVV